MKVSDLTWALLSTGVMVQYAWGQSFISSVTPKQNTLNVDKATNIKITFAQDINSVTLTDSRIKVNGSLSGLHLSSSIPISYNNNTKTAVFTPKGTFMVGEVVNVTLTDAIKTSNGKSISPYTWSFTIKSPDGTGKLAKASEQKVKGTAYSVATGDFNGDGRLDWAVTNYDTSTISIFINGRDTTLFVGDNPRSITLLDFDADGDLDLAAANANGHRIGIIENKFKQTGTHSFQKGDRPYVGEGPSYSITSGDFDSDGDLDLAVTHRSDASNYVSILKNEMIDGKRRFKQDFNNRIALEGTSYSVNAGDFDRDGFLDLAVADSNFNKIVVLQNNGDGKFSKVSPPIPSGGQGPVSIASGDFDRDGYLDLVVSNARTISILINDRAGSFKLSSNKIQGLGGKSWSVTIGDFDSDGMLDLITGNGGNVYILKNDGKGGFVNSSLDFDVEGNPIAVAAGDFDGDGTVDVAVARKEETLGSTQHAVIILKNRPAAPDILLSNTTLNFGKVKQLSSKTIEFTIRNEGGEKPLKITGITLSNPNHAFIAQPDTSQILSLDSLKIKVTFTPTERKIYHERLSISSDDPDEPLVTMYLTGEGEAMINAPRIISPAPPASPEVGLPIIIDANITMSSAISEIILYYRKGGEENVKSKSMSLRGASYQETISSDAVTSRGVEYYFEMKSRNHLTARSGTFSIPVHVKGQGEMKRNAQGEPVPQPHGAYHLFSVPLNLNNKRPEAVLRDDLGEYDKKKWRFFELRTDQSWVEFPNTSPMTPGKAFWLIVKEAKKVIDTGSGISIPTDRPYAIPLSPGWNFIANPFNFSAYAIDSLNNGEPFSLYSCKKGEWSDPLKPASIALQRFEGYAVKNKADSTVLMWIAAYKPKPGNILAKTEGFEPSWKIRILAQCQQAYDNNNVAAVAARAAVGWDEMDQPEPPVIGEYVSAYFPHLDWERFSDAYCTDVRPELFESEVWEFEVKTNIRDRVELSFDGLAGVPQEFEVWLIDEALEVSQNLRERRRYAFAPFADEKPKRLKLVVGKAGLVKEKFTAVQVIPNSYELSQNFPNPFNPVTTIRYGLPESASLALKVYNALGEEVVTLINEKQKAAGYHVVVWDGRNQAGVQMASGLYFYQLRAGNVSMTKKMVLIR